MCETKNMSFLNVIDDEQPPTIEGPIFSLVVPGKKHLLKKICVQCRKFRVEKNLCKTIYIFRVEKICVKQYIFFV